MSSKSEKVTNTWVRPELVKLGKLVDVAPHAAGSGQGINNFS